MSLTENSNQVFLPGGAANSQNSPYISDWPLVPLDQVGQIVEIQLFLNLVMLYI